MALSWRRRESGEREEGLPSGIRGEGRERKGKGK